MHRQKGIVSANAKILIFKQLTTQNTLNIAIKDCFCQCKDTNF